MAELHDRIRAWWDEDAGTYDAAAGHSMSDPIERAAWRAVLERSLPPAPARVLDVGAGTGAMSLLASELGYDVTGVDLSEGMLARARRKADEDGLAVTFALGSAAEPPPGPFDAVMERHVLWTIDDPVTALRGWRERVAPGGRLAVFEGSWGGSGPFAGFRESIHQAARRLLRRDGAAAHHAPYPPEILDGLPLAGAGSPEPFVAAVRDAGWRRIRIVRLRDVEWAVARREPWPLGWLGHRDRWALLAEA